MSRCACGGRRAAARRLLGALALAAAALAGGCSTLGYYGQAVAGHLAIVQRARPVTELLDDAATPAALRARLELSRRLRDFAVAELALPDNRSYRSYAALGRDAAVYNVVAAPELSLELKTWCVPLLGCVGYRGWFARADAEALAAQLRSEGWETSVYGVPAYSTLGRFDWLGGDPLLDTFIGWPDGDLARLVFHELAHQVVYVGDDTTFNESFADAVGRLGAARWLARHGSAEARAADAVREARRRDFRALTLRWRDALGALYASTLADDDKRRRKAALYAAMRADYARLKAERWEGFAGYDGWFERADNAALGVQAAYDELVPQFERLFERAGGDFARFHAAVRVLAALPRSERRAKLAAND